MSASWLAKMGRLVSFIKNERWGEWIGWPAWLVTCFLTAMVTVGIFVAVTKLLGISLATDSTLGNMVVSACIYAVIIALLICISRVGYVIKLAKGFNNLVVAGVALALIVALSYMHILNFLAIAVLVVVTGLFLVLSGIPKDSRFITKKTLGIQRDLSWSDVGLGLAGYVIYFFAFVAITVALVKFFPAYNSTQAQDLGFSALYGVDRLIGFIVLVIITPFAEELIMRGFLFGKLRESKMSFWPAAIVVSIMFGVAHGQWNVGVDTLILSLVACYLREVTGTIWPGIVIHMAKNAVAYIMLFVLAVR